MIFEENKSNTSDVPGEATRRAGGIALLGVPISSRNQGVQALGASLVNLCAGARGECPGICLMTGNARPDVVTYQTEAGPLAVSVVNYRLSPKSAPRQHLGWIVLMSLLYRMLPVRSWRRWISRGTPWIAALEEVTFAGDIRGGDSFSDIYGTKRFLIGFLVAWSVILVKGTIIQFPQTYGPYKGRLARRMARFLLRRSAVVVARDKASQRVAQDLLGDSGEVLLSPDVAFSLKAVRPETPRLDPPLAGSVPAGVVGINVNGLMFHGGYTRSNMFGLKMDYPGFLSELLDALLAAHAGEIWLVPHTYAPEGDVESDPDACRLLRETLPEAAKQRVRIVAAEYNQHEIKGVIGMCGFFVGSRMHSCIAALSQGVPCVGVAYSMKFRGVFESVGMADWVVDGRETTNQEAVAEVMELYRNRERMRGPLRANADRARHELREVFSRMLAGVESSANRLPDAVNAGRSRETAIADSL